MEINFGVNKDVKVVILKNQNHEVRLNFENFAELIGLYIILSQSGADSVFTKNLKLLKKDKNFIIVRKNKNQNKNFKIILTSDEFQEVLDELKSIYKYFSSSAIDKFV